MEKSNVEKGHDAENIALEYLIKLGYQILETNWRSKRAEIDIIAKDGSILVFIEVKSRSYNDLGDPSMGVNAKKKKLLTAAATSYMEAIDYRWELRFDIISIVMRTKDDFDMEHYKDAFFPGL